MTAPCTEYQRLQKAEKMIDVIEQDLQRMEKHIDAMTNEVHTLAVEMRGLTANMNNLVSQLEASEKMKVDMFMQFKSTFERFGNRLDKMEEKHEQLAGALYNRLRDIEGNLNRGATGALYTERILWGLLTGLGGLIIFYLQRQL